MKEIIIDLFAGGGGASEGIEQALSVCVDEAINHDPQAIAMHEANHSNTRHYIEDVFVVNPYKVADGRSVGLLWASPDCTHHSRAKGSKPRDKKIRGLAWVVVKWAKAVRPRVIILENVPEFKEWGPLDDKDCPIQSKSGMTFNLWANQLRGLGYEVQFRELSACDYGAPTTRKRLFVVARCDGRPIVWPEPTHAEPGNIFGLPAYRTAAECIDWSIPCPSIFERKRPLVPNTLRRIAKGIQKFVIEAKEPFIVKIGQTGSNGYRVSSIKEPLRTVVSKAEDCLVIPHLSKYHGLKANEARGQVCDEPIRTLDTQTVTATGQHIGEVRAFLIKYYGTNIGHGLKKPMHTVTSKHRFGLVTIAGVDYQIADIGLRMLQPRELARAQGFSDSYILTGTKTSQVAKIGNSVCPPMAKVLVAANVELREIKERQVG